MKTFDEWFFDKHGVTFENMHEQPSMMVHIGMRALSRALRDYVSEMAAS